MYGLTEDVKGFFHLQLDCTLYGRFRRAWVHCWVAVRPVKFGGTCGAPVFREAPERRFRGVSQASSCFFMFRSPLNQNVRSFEDPSHSPKL